MAQVLVRDLDPAIVEKLKARATAHGRSLQAELKAILEAQASQATKAEARALAACIRQRSGNILWKKARRGELTTADARLIWDGLERQPITIFPSSLVIEPAFEGAFDTNRTVYDSCYLALVRLVDYQLVTADQRLFNALKDGSYAIHLCWVADLP